MSRGQFAVLTILLSVAILVGAAVGSFLIGAPLGASAEELRLAPPPSSSAAVVVPSFADLAEKIIPSVVLVTNKSVTSEDPHAELPLFRRFFREPFGEEQQQEKPRERVQQSSGSGFFITEDGYLLTNRHVVEGAETLEVLDSDDNTYEARLIGVDPGLDLALLKIDGHKVSPLPLGDSDELRVGEWVMAIGNPISYRSSVTVGVVSGKGRRLGFDPADLGSYIQTDAAINFGNSGGPLLNARGEVVGINTAIIRGGGSPLNSRAGLVEGIGFALPISKARKVLDQLATTGTVKRGYLGVTVGPVDAEAQEYYKLPERRGALVTSAEPGLPAAKAGVQRGDVILEVNGNQVESQSELVESISSLAPGDKVRLKLWRTGEDGEGETREVTVVLGVRPTNGTDTPEVESQPESGGEVTDLGISVAPMPGNMRETLERQGITGLLITDVDVRSNAFDKGLRQGMILVELNDVSMKSLDDYRRVAREVKPGAVLSARVAFTSGDQLVVFFRAPEQGD